MIELASGGLGYLAEFYKLSVVEAWFFFAAHSKIQEQRDKLKELLSKA